jgi:hypothetical protein
LNANEDFNMDALRRDLDRLEGQGHLSIAGLEELVGRHHGVVQRGSGAISGLIPVGHDELLVVHPTAATLWVTGPGTVRMRYLRIWDPIREPFDPYLVWGFMR